MINSIFLLTVILPICQAQGSFTSWSPPGPGDVRSPCPALNTLANHGFLPHNGKGIRISDLITALDTALNVGADFATAAGTAGLLSVPGNPFATSFNLDNLNEHNFPIEHDASLSRSDYYASPTRDNHSFNQTIFNQVLSFYASQSETSIPVAAAAKYARVKFEQGNDSRFTYQAQQFLLSYSETALYLSVLGDPVSGVANVDWVKVFFQEERLPYEEGWRRGGSKTNLSTLAAMTLKLVAANKEALPEGLVVTAQTIGLTFGGLDPITGLLRHIIG